MVAVAAEAEAVVVVVAAVHLEPLLTHPAHLAHLAHQVAEAGVGALPD